MDTENSTEAQGIIWPTDVWLHQWACAAHKPWELKYLQDEYKKHRAHVNVKDKDLLCCCILPAN